MVNFEHGSLETSLYQVFMEMYIGLIANILTEMVIELIHNEYK